MTDKLKPCPFCGAGCAERHPDIGFVVWCPECKAHGPTVSYGDKTREEKWNTRSINSTDGPNDNALREAAAKALNFIENTESELGITLDSGNALRTALNLSSDPVGGATRSASVIDDGLLEENAELISALAAVNALIEESGGVFGLHLNGDPSPWDELRSGGRFEDWLAPFDAVISKHGYFQKAALANQRSGSNG